MTSTQTSLYERLGGRDGIVKVTKRFYGLVRHDETLAPKFKRKNIRKIERLTAAYLIWKTGGGAVYHGRPLAEAHKNVNASAADFRAVAAHLEQAMIEEGIKRAEINDVLAFAKTLIPDIVTTGQ